MPIEREMDVLNALNAEYLTYLNEEDATITSAYTKIVQKRRYRILVNATYDSEEEPLDGVSYINFSFIYHYHYFFYFFSSRVIPSFRSRLFLVLFQPLQLLKELNQLSIHLLPLLLRFISHHVLRLQGQ